MEKVTFFDVEYANAKNKSICQIGILCEDFIEKESFYPELNLYINPEDDFDNMCVRIHGISKSMVEHEPNFAEIWEDIEKYFTNSVVVGHNVASADIDALIKTLRRYDLDIPELYYVDTYDLAKKYVPRFEVPNYGMGTLCEYFGVNAENPHNAFYDAYANSNLFHEMVKRYQIDVDSFVHKYSARETKEFSAYLSNTALREKISELYGVLRGFTLDNEITKSEADYLLHWKRENAKYSGRPEIAGILSEIDNIVSDGIVTVGEMLSLQRSIKQYIDVVTVSLITLATQILNGIIRGIIHDGAITVNECNNLRIWMYDNIYLSGHFPFNRMLETLDKVLDDGVLTATEASEIMTVIRELLDPVSSMRKQILSVDGKHICLSGDFKRGNKATVEIMLMQKGAVIDASLKKTTDILMVGDFGSGSYSNGEYGTKVKKAMEYNEKGSNIQIIKEADFFDD